GCCSHGHSDGARGEEEDTRGTPVRHGSAVRLSGTAVRRTRGTPVPYTRDSQRHTRAVLGRVAAGCGRAALRGCGAGRGRVTGGRQAGRDWALRVGRRGGAVQGLSGVVPGAGQGSSRRSFRTFAGVVSGVVPDV